MRSFSFLSALLLSGFASAQYATPKGTGPVAEMPVLGLGTFGIGGWAIGKENNMTLQGITRDVVKMGLKKGFRHLDAATVYGNEKGVGLGLNAALNDGVKREDIWITTKLWSSK
jgi:alcohol dehydrogenase (NADP+)